MEAGPGVAVSAHVSHPPSRSGWLDEAITLLGSAGRSPRCRKAVLQDGGGALWVDGKAVEEATESELRNSPKRSGLEQGWVSELDDSRNWSNGSTVSGTFPYRLFCSPRGETGLASSSGASPPSRSPGGPT